MAISRGLLVWFSSPWVMMTSVAAERVPRPICRPAETVVWRLRRAGRDQVLVEHVLKLQAQLAKAGGRRVGQIVGDGIQVQLLGAHAAGGCVQGSNHVDSFSFAFSFRSANCGSLQLRTLRPAAISSAAVLLNSVWKMVSALHGLGLALHHDQVQAALNHILVGGLEAP
jgi:hypothetical protein